MPVIDPQEEQRVIRVGLYAEHVSSVYPVIGCNLQPLLRSTAASFPQTQSNTFRVQTECCEYRLVVKQAGGRHLEQLLAQPGQLKPRLERAVGRAQLKQLRPVTRIIASQQRKDEANVAY
jgi:hypothetical protein